MSQFPPSSFAPGQGPAALLGHNNTTRHRKLFTQARFLIWLALLWLPASSVQAVVLWTDPDTTLACNTGVGKDILGGAVKRDESANDTLYFKFQVDPLSDTNTEEYFAALELYDGDTERLGIGNSLKAWAYSAFFHSDETGTTNMPEGYIDLHSLRPEHPTDGTTESFQYPRRGVGVTIVFKVQYVPGEDDLVTVWLNPDLGPGANEAYQPDGLTTRFIANGKFDEIRLRHGGGGEGWKFSDLAIATSFSDFVDVSSAWPSVVAGGLGGARAFNFRSWQTEQGLPEVPVRALCQTHDGYIWVGGDNGLARFDGLRFVSFGLAEGIQSGPVSTLMEDHQGALWIGTATSGLRRWLDNKIRAFGKRNGLPSNDITALAEDQAKKLWIGTKEGLICWPHGEPSGSNAVLFFKGHAITALQEDAEGTMWAGVNGEGTFQFTNNEPVPVVNPEVNSLLKDVHSLFKDRAGKMWVGAGEEAVLCWNGKHWRSYRIPYHVAGTYVNSLAEESDGTIWAGSTIGGLMEFTDGKFSAIPAGSGLAGNTITSLFSDREGRLWVGTESGLNRIHHQCLFPLGQGEGLGYGEVAGLAEVRPGVIWAAKPNDGLYRWDGKSFGRVPAKGLSLHDSQITSLLVTHDGLCWVATTKSLLLYKDPIAAADEVCVIPDAKPDIMAMAEGSDGSLWLGSRQGKLWQLHEGWWRERRDLTQTNAITAIVAAADGSLWVATAGNGLYRLNGQGQIFHFGRAEGLASDVITTLYHDAHDSLWIGTEDHGLSRWQDGRVDNFTPAAGLPANIRQIVEDDSGRLWLGGKSGVVCVGKERLEDLAAGKITAVYPQSFSEEEGAKAEECTGGFFPSGLKTKSGLLWFSTARGVLAVNPAVQPLARHRPNTVLEEVLVDGVANPLMQGGTPHRLGSNEAAASDADQTETWRITPGKHQVEFRYTGLNFDAPEQIHFLYRLEGLDSDWIDAGTRRTAFYNYLPPGDYRFRLAARNSDGDWTTSTADLQLIILRHFWQTWWFIGFAALSLLGGVAVTVRVAEKNRLNRRLKLLEQERALERERTRIAQDLHDEMGAKLCRISFLSEHTRRGPLVGGELKEQITSISDASRELLHSLDEIVWAVNPKNDTLEHVASYISQYAQDYFQVTGVQCELDIPPQLPPYPISSQMRHHVFLATHEAMTNILKHSGATRAKITMTYDGNALHISIADNGKGFCHAANGSSGDGLDNMQKRLAGMGGRCQIESVPGKGTTIRFVIPLNLHPKGS